VSAADSKFVAATVSADDSNFVWASSGPLRCPRPVPTSFGQNLVSFCGETVAAEPFGQDLGGFCGETVAAEPFGQDLGGFCGETVAAGFY